MFKMYVAGYSGNNLYLESTDKAELIERYNTFAENENVIIAQLVEDVEGKARVDLSNELKIKKSDTIFD